MATRKHKTDDLDALSILQGDHERVERMFAAYGKTRNKAEKEEKAALVAEVCLELALHAAVEEQVFYPAASRAIGDGELMGEAVVEHGEARHLIHRLVGMDPGDPLYDPTVQVLRAYVHHHVQEEQDKMFPRIRKAKLDLEALGETILDRKGELMTEVEDKGLECLLPPPAHDPDPRPDPSLAALRKV